MGKPSRASASRAASSSIPAQVSLAETKLEMVTADAFIPSRAFAARGQRVKEAISRSVASVSLSCSSLTAAFPASDMAQ